MATQPSYIYGDSITYVLNIARSRISDLLQTPDGSPTGQVGGSTLLRQLDDEGNVFLPTQIITNAAWRKFQKYIGNLGYRRMIGDDLIFEELPINNNADPAIHSWISWNGFFNGTELTETPALPSDFLAPLFVWERLSNQNAQFQKMLCALDGLKSQFQRTIYDIQWEWREAGLYFPGALNLTDKKLRYIKRLPDFLEVVDGEETSPWYERILDIPDAASPLAWYITYEVCVPRMGEAESAGILVQAQGEAELLFNDQARADLRTNVRRIPRGRNTRIYW